MWIGERVGRTEERAGILKRGALSHIFFTCACMYIFP